MAVRGTQQWLGRGPIDDPWADLLVAVIERAKADAAGNVTTEPREEWRSLWQKDAKAFIAEAIEDPGIVWC